MVVLQVKLQDNNEEQTIKAEGGAAAVLMLQSFPGFQKGQDHGSENFATFWWKIQTIKISRLLLSLSWFPKHQK